MTSKSGTIGGWQVGANSIQGQHMTLYGAGEIRMGDGLTPSEDGTRLDYAALSALDPELALVGGQYQPGSGSLPGKQVG